MKRLIQKLCLALVILTGLPSLSLFGMVQSLLNCDVTNQQQAGLLKELCPLLAKTAIRLFKNGDLYFFDGVAGDNQCHIVALEVARLFKSLQEKSILLDENNVAQQEKLDPETRFLMLNLLSSSCFQSDVGCLVACVEKTTGVVIGRKKKSKMTQLLQERWLRNQVKSELAKLVRGVIKQAISQDKELEQLHFCTEKLAQNGVLNPQFPKFAGVNIMLKLAKKARIPLVFKVKMLCKKGVRVVDIVPSKADDLLGASPVVVIDAVSSLRDDIVSFDDFLKHRSCCAHNLFNLCSVKKHKDGCLNCLEHNTSDDCKRCKLQLNKLQRLDHRDIQLAIAAAFMESQQQDCIDVMQQVAPNLDKKRQEALKRAKSNGMIGNDISTLFIEHMHAATWGKFKGKRRLVDSRPKEIVEALKRKHN